MIKNNNKGFSLMELMVVVGIIAVISMIAIPNFQRFQAKAKQANAKSELASIYGMEKAFFTEFGVYNPNLVLIGYTPDGVPLTANGCADTAAASVARWPIRYYSVGFPGIANVNVPGTTRSCDADVVINAKPKATDNAITAIASNGTIPSVVNPVAGAAGASTFIAVANGMIGGPRNDLWNINQNKQLTNHQAGY